MAHQLKHVILFAACAPHPLAGELSRAGIVVFEALAISDVLALAEQHSDWQILITAEVERERAAIIQQHYPTMQLNADATVKDILWELNVKGTTIQ